MSNRATPVWRTDDDYDPEGVEWLNTTHIGSWWDEQLDANKAGHFRHRYRASFGSWIKGPAPHGTLPKNCL